MRISDWSSDVFSSDLLGNVGCRGLPVDGGREREDDFFDAAPGLAARIGCTRHQPSHVELVRAAPVDRRQGAAEHLVAPLEGARARSEEHTSELQSLMRISYAVFCLKKKKTHKK